MQLLDSVAMFCPDSACIGLREANSCRDQFNQRVTYVTIGSLVCYRVSSAFSFPILVREFDDARYSQ